jgi:hypothetical protein
VCASAIERGYNSPHVQASAIWRDVVYSVTAVAIVAVSSKKIAVPASKILTRALSF